MRRYYRLVGCFLLVALVFSLTLIRQYNQWLFIETQSVIQEERVLRESLNEQLIHYLDARQDVIEWAEAQGYVLRSAG